MYPFKIKSDVFKIFLFLLLFVFSVGCSPSLQRSVTTITKNETNAKVAQEAIHETHPIVTAGNASRYYSQKKPEVITGETRIDTVYEKGETITLPCEDEAGKVVPGVTAKAPAPVYIYTTRTDTLKIPDEGLIRTYVLQSEKDRDAKVTAVSERNEAQKELKEVEADLTRAYWFGVIMLLIICGMFYLFVIRRR